MPLFRGSSPVTKVYRGSSLVQKIYRGSTLVADFGAPPAPTRAFIRDVAVSQHPAGGSATAKTFNRPANVVAGDLLLLFALSDEDAIASFTPPTGFTHPTGTAEALSGTNRAIVSISQKVATGSEPSTYTHGAFGITGDGMSIIYAIGNVGAATDTRVMAASSATSATSLISPTVTPVAAKNLLIRGISQDGGATGTVWTPGAAPTDYSLLRSDHGPSGWLWSGMWVRDYDSVAATGTQAFTMSSVPSQNRVGVGFSVAIPSI